MATVTLSSPITATVTSSPSERLQNGLAAVRDGDISSSRDGGNRRLLRRPQISIEQADDRLNGDKSHHETAELHKTTPDKSVAESDDSHLQVSSHAAVHNKSTSLPLTSSLDQFLDQHTPSVESSAYNSSDFSDDGLSQTSSQVVTRDPRSKKLDSTDPFDGISSAETSSDDESTLGMTNLMLPSVVDHDDEVFHEFGDIDLCNEADSKLVDWSFNVFIPACRTLLLDCSVGEDTELSSGQIQADLRSLSNIINYFCTEQQRLSGQLKFNVRGISSSLSTDRFHRVKDKGGKNLEPQLGNSNTASMSSDSASSGFESQDSQFDRSYAVKILRSVSQSLIVPLLQDSESGFTPDLYKSIVQAIQKIAWKVEACLSFNDPTKVFNIYSQIFDGDRNAVMLDMMIRALPPDEPKLQNSAGRASRSGSMSTRKSLSSKDDNLLETGSSHVIKRTPSGRARPGGLVLDSFPGENRENSQEEVDVRSAEYDTLLEASSDSLTTQQNDLPQGRRATYASPRRLVSDSFDNEVCRAKEREFTESTANRMHYFRPSYHRRTTVSLSRREVTKLGLTVVKRVDESIVGNMGVRRGGEEAGRSNNGDGVEAQMNEVKSRLELLEQRFDKDAELLERSVSTSDLLDDPQNGNKAERKTRHQTEDGVGHVAAKKQGSVESPNLNSNLKKSYKPAMKRQVSDPHTSTHQDIGSDWTYVNPSTSWDPTTWEPGRARAYSKKQLVEKGAKKVSSKAKKAVEKSLSTSGRFASKLVKTAQALRRGSVSASKRKQTVASVVVSTSMDELLEEPSPETSPVSYPRKVTSKSEPPSPMPKSGTMPNKRSKSTLPRLAPRPKSSKVNSLSRRRKGSSKTSGFLLSDPPSTTALTEIYRLSNSAVQPSHGEGDQMISVISVEYSSKMSKKRSSLISTSSGSMWYDITVVTNMKRLGRSHYTIHRTVKQVLALYDAIAASYPEAALPDRPGKRSPLKAQKRQLEDFLHHLAQSPELRPSDPFVLFLMPEEELRNFTDNSEISFELLMTFYTPDVYPGPPGSHSEIHMVSPDDIVPNTPSPARSRKHSSLQKRGTMHYLKQDGKEDGSTFVIREEGQDALIVSCEDERYMVVAGTFEKLVEQLACEEKPDPRFVMTFLLGYRHFSSTMGLLSRLLDRFHMAVAPDATEEELSYAEKWRYVIQLRVIDVLTYWLKKCWPDFYREETVLNKVQEFITQLKASHDTNFQLAGTNLDKVLSDKLSSSDQYVVPAKVPSLTCDVPTTPTCSTTSSAHTYSDTGGLRSPRHATPMDITAISAVQLARQLTLIELEALGTIDTHELVVYTWEQNTPKNKPYRRNIDEYITRFNKLSFWVCSEIISIHDAKVRGLLIEKFIEVAKHCQENKNFNSTISIMSGLSLGAVRRLKKSWDFVNEKFRKTFDKMALIMSPANNHISYRKLLSTVHRRDPCIPYFGVFMRDLTFFNDGNHKTLKNGLLNFSKLRTMVYKFEELKRYQRSKYFFPPEDKIQEFCKNLWCFSESELYEMSLELEPREAPPQPPPEETDV